MDPAPLRSHLEFIVFLRFLSLVLQLLALVAASSGTLQPLTDPSSRVRPRLASLCLVPSLIGSSRHNTSSSSLDPAALPRLQPEARRGERALAAACQAHQL